MSGRHAAALRVGRRSRRGRAAALSIACLGALAAPAAGHPLAPSLLSLVESGPGVFDVQWKVSRLRPGGNEVSPVLPAHCRSVRGVERSDGPADRTERWTVDCGESGLVGHELAVAGLDATRTDALLRVELRDGRSMRALLDGDGSGYRVPTRESRWQVFRSYVGLGVEHLLFGFDHVLFVIGLVLLVTGWRRLVATVTAFTLGHSVTLSLATLGWIRLPSSLFEIAIAASIWILGAELTRPAESQASGGDPENATAGSPERRGSVLRRRPWAMSFGFGLLHGLGFAGALSEIGLPQQAIPLALLAFNVGVEAGQLLVVLATVLLLFAWRGARLPALPAARRALAYGIGALAAYWMLERSAGALGLV